MATTKNITMKQFNGTDYDTLYPKTKVEQIENLTPSSIGAVAKSGDTMTGNLNITNSNPYLNLVETDSQEEYLVQVHQGDFYIGSKSHGSVNGLVLKPDGTVLAKALYTVLHTGNAQSLGFSKIATGSYVGTGTFGVNNPCSLTFPFSPKILIFFERHHLSYSSGPFDMLAPSLSTIGNYGVPRIWLANTNHQITQSIRDTTYGDDGVYVQVSWGVTTQWYAIGQSKEPSAGTQLNISGLTYDYCAIG